MPDDDRVEHATETRPATVERPLRDIIEKGGKQPPNPPPAPQALAEPPAAPPAAPADAPPPSDAE